jgi:small subunit ribosomal protein S20
VANHPQALKRHRQSEKARARNKHYKSMVRTVVKKATAATGKAATKAFRSAESTIQSVAAKGVIPRKRASRKVARLAKALKQTA